MRSGHRIILASATVSMAAALASPTFGINLAFDTSGAFSNIKYFHDAESLDAAAVEGVNVRNLTVGGTSIPNTSAPGYQLGSGTVFQNGGIGTGSSSGKMGIGRIEDSRTTTMTLQSGTFVSQTETTTNTALKMDGASTISASFSLSWVATGAYGAPIVGRISIPLSGFVAGTGSASVELKNVRWLVDLAGTSPEYLARSSFDGKVTFNSSSPTTATLSSTSESLKDPSGGILTMQAGDRFTLKGTLIFTADANSPAEISFDNQYSDPYGTEVLSDAPVRYYRLNEDAQHTPPVVFDDLETFDDDEDYPPVAIQRTAYDSSGFNRHGEYVGNVTPEAPTANFSLGTAARFPQTVTFSEGPSNEIQTFNEPIQTLGIGDVILAPNTSDVQFASAGGGNPFTLEAWVSREGFLGTGLGNFASIIDMQDGTGNGMRFGINNNAIFVNAGVGGTDAAFVLTDGGQFEEGEFYHLVAVHNASGNLEFYVNGQSLGVELPFALFNNSGDAFIRIGNSINGFSDFLGIIDEVAIYNYALSAQTILDHFNAGEDNSSFVPLMGIEVDEDFVDLAVVPEPATATLAVLAVTSLVLPRRRRQM